MRSEYQRILNRTLNETGICTLAVCCVTGSFPRHAFLSGCGLHDQHITRGHPVARSNPGLPASSRHEAAFRRRGARVHVAATVHVIVDLRRASEHSRVQEYGERRSFQRVRRILATAIGLPKHFQQQSGNDGIDIDAIDIARYAAVEQGLHQHAIELVEHVVFAALGEQFVNE